jgi:hypothetical protein
MKTVLVSGAIANKLDKGGDVWVRLQWALGLKKLGFRVVFLEQFDKGACVDAAGRVTEFAASRNRAFFREVMSRFGLAETAALIYDDGAEIDGLDREAVLDIARSAECLINISGNLSWPALQSPVRRKVFLDIDPGYTQYWYDAGNSGARLAGHDFFFTIGQNIGTAYCPIPTADILWRKTRPVVALDEWPDVAGGQFDRFTTVASWRGGYGRVEHQGRSLGLKAHEFRKFLGLPQQARQPFEIALDIHAGDARDRDALINHGWRLVSPLEAAGTPERFRDYIQHSGAEFSVAQGIYVETNCGWFSDRSAAYLASGKPVLVQDTGFSRHYPVGEGLLTFRTLAEAIDGAQRIAEDYPRHCRAARALAETWFDSDRVLLQLLEEIGVTP